MREMNSRKRCTQFGLEVPETVTWRNWEPGKEYTKNIPIKNVKVKTQKIHYRVPTLQVFSSHYPEPISLSSGTSHVISVSFKPVELGVYKDRIVVQTEEGELEIPIKATLPEPRIELVESIQFGMVALTDTNSVSFKLKNSSEVSVNFSFDVPKPFTISPKQGLLPAKENCQLLCTFTPTTASVYTANAICVYEGCKRNVELMGTGKFAYIEVETSKGVVTRKVDFRNVPMGQTATRTILLSNKSPVTAPYRIRPLWQDKGPVSPFSSSPLEGRIAALEKQQIRVTFTPNNPGAPFIDYLSVECVGSHTETTVTCVANATRPSVTLSSRCIEFSSVYCNTSAKRVIEIRNSSNVSSVYQFLNATNTVFSVVPCTGRMEANSKHNLTITFHPTDPLPYYRRLSCLILHQDPVCLEVLGTGVTDADNPVLLRQNHLVLYASRWLSGLACYPPDQLKKWHSDNYITLSETEIHVCPTAPFVKELHSNPPILDPYDHIFTPNVMSQFILDRQEIDFGSSTLEEELCTHTVLATNLSKGVINCVWIIPREFRDNFSVRPRITELGPGANFEFRVAFSPSQRNKYYDSTLECFAYYKTLKDYHSVEDVFVSPSWCSTLQVSAHTWQKGLDSSPSSLAWDSKEIVFTPSLPSSCSYKTFRLLNNRDVPIQFNFREFENDAFEILPKLGLLSQENQIFLLKMKTPLFEETKHKSLITTTILCDINHDTKHPEKLILSGTIQSPRVAFPDSSYVYFHPCVVDGRVKQGLRVKNTSQLPVEFVWTTQGAVPGITRITPNSGIMQPNEIQTHDWVFTPTNEGRHSFKGIIATNFPQTQHYFKQSISLVGNCCQSKLHVSEPRVNFGNITVRSNQKDTVVLINSSLCDLTYKLSYNACYTNREGQTETCRPKELCVSSQNSTIIAGSRHFVDITFKPQKQGDYDVEVFYQIVTKNNHVTANQPLFRISAVVSYPRLAVTDTKLKSLTGHVSKTRLWEMLNLDKLNELLKEEPSYDEMRYDIATRHSMKRKIPVLTRAIVDFNMGSGPINSPDSEILLLLQNPSHVDVEYAFQFPDDMYLEPEYWADTGELDQFEERELFLMQNSIFSVEEKSGSLAPGESRVIKCSHKHTVAGESVLPVLLKIRRGREVLLNFRGITSQLSTPHVNFTTDVFNFRPIPVGLLLPPLQAYKLYNGGDTACPYELITTPLLDLIQQTNGLQVLECLNPIGTLPAYGYTELLFLFTPPEPVRYSVEMWIKLDPESKLITFIGEGFTMDQNSRNNQAVLADKQETVRVPHKHLITSTTETATLSSNTISFRHLPLFSPARQITFLRNHSNQTLSYKWEFPSDRISDVLTIKPTQGYLHPNQRQLCEVLFVSMVDPSFYDVTLSCVITDESSMLVYRHELVDWERQQVEKQHMFTITSSSIQKNKSHKKVSQRHNTLPPLEQDSYEDWIRKDLSKKSKHRPRKNKETENPKPSPPLPFILELCVNARTHSIADHCTLFPDAPTLFIDTHEIISSMKTADTDIPITQSSSQLLTSVLSSLLHSLIHDNSFISCLARIDKEPTPYFNQFQQQKLAISEITDTELIPDTHRPLRVGSAPTRISDSTRERATSRQLNKLKKLESTNILLEGVLENSIRCILSEAISNEIEITAKPHWIALMQDIT